MRGRGSPVDLTWNAHTYVYARRAFYFKIVTHCEYEIEYYRKFQTFDEKFIWIFENIFNFQHQLISIYIIIS